MDDDRVWNFETSLWTCDAEHYRQSIDSTCVMVLPEEPYVMTGAQAIDAVSATPRWTKVELTHRCVSRPQEGLIVVAYQAHAERDGVSPYQAYCTSTYRRLGHEDWRVVQHQQTVPLVAEGAK
jgi:hypothetical protein